MGSNRVELPRGLSPGPGVSASFAACVCLLASVCPSLQCFVAVSLGLGVAVIPHLHISV